MALSWGGGFYPLTYPDIVEKHTGMTTCVVITTTKHSCLTKSNNRHANSNVSRDMGHSSKIVIK